jgi:hypothetical protein
VQCGQAAESGEERDGGIVADYSKTQIDRLGERLKKVQHSDEDLRMLNDYRRSFRDAYNQVLQVIRRRSESPTGRIAKSTLSIVQKLRRESIRLSQIQDIAGCRIIVQDIIAQDNLVAALRMDFPEAAVVDRRVNSSHGYRAVHIIVGISGKAVEIQVRSALQHLWAELSEKSSDVLDPTIKYGGGSKSWQFFLTKSSEAVAAYERFEITYFDSEMRQKAALVAYEVFEKSLENFRKHHQPEQAQELRHMQGQFEELKRTNIRLEKNVEQLRIRLKQIREMNMSLLSGAISSLQQKME